MKILYSLIVFTATSIGAMTGLGGGVIIKPMFDFIGYHDVTSISFYSSCAVLVMSCYSVYKNLKGERQFDLNIVVTVAIGAALGGFVGTMVFDALIEVFSEPIVSNIQSAILIVLLLFVLSSMIIRYKSYKIKNKLAIFTVGIVLGFMSAFLGIGGGPINVAAFTILFGFNFKAATIYSIATIMFSQITSLATKGLTRGFTYFDLSYLLYIIPFALLGGVIGTYIGRRTSENTLKRLFSCVMVFLVLLNFINFLVL
ncbi:hypothetical protein AOC36_08320 [Erysipelothrix larvae]|uniref:Probable membrane transporter protein n=1 Tax=Erysipelothrix larvae TaxID=1514105 RepID=A0A109UHB4_9FIRM|nr:sulfite exporter TauE/SafE family protein [Erysipelothrix larvae]AMC93990.1 hypothetical protein AOC36_08320 [Erysipelothrix larvae]